METKESFFLLHCKEQLQRGVATPFLNKGEVQKLKSLLKQIPYQVFVPFPDSEYCCLYQNELPPITCFEVLGSSCTHSELMGSFFQFSFDRHLLGDILVKDRTFLLVVSSIASFLSQSMTHVGKKPVHLKEVPIEEIADFSYSFETKSYTVSSVRLDTVVSKIVMLSRNSLDELFKKGAVLVNYEERKKGNRELKEGDILSIRHYGKYILSEIGKQNKKGKWCIEIKQFH